MKARTLMAIVGFGVMGLEGCVGMAPSDWRSETAVPTVQMEIRPGLAEATGAPAEPAMAETDHAVTPKAGGRGTMVWIDAADPTAVPDPHRMRLGTTLRFR